MLKENLADNALYVGVSYIPDSEWNIYTGSLDSDSTFWGGTDSEYGDGDKTFYNQTMYSMHKTLQGGLTRVVERSDWVYGTTYDAYPSKTNKCYALAKSFESGFARLNVYMCVFSPGTASTVPPSGTSATAIKYNDNYVWKYLYSISNSEALRFLSDKWMSTPERIPISEYPNITTDSPNYNQYLTQISATPGQVFGVNVDSDLLVNHIAADSDFRVAFNYNSISLIGRDIPGNTPSRYFRMNLLWDSGKNSFYTTFRDSGQGYVGPVTIGMDSDSATVSGITATVAPGSGFGTNIPSELGARNIMISVRNVPDLDEVIYNGSQYNLITLQVDPIETSSGLVAQKQTYITCNYFEIDGINNWKVGDRFYSKFNTNSPIGIVIAIDGNKVYYTIPQSGRAYESFKDSEILEVEPGVKQKSIHKHYGREIVFDSGGILIANYKDATVTRSQDQIEAFNFVLEF